MWDESMDMQHALTVKRRQASMGGKGVEKEHLLISLHALGKA